MSDLESESESDLDFSASEDEYVPEGDSDSENENDDDEEEEDGDEAESPEKIDRAKQKRNTRKNTEAEDDDSDSSVENYLVNPNEIDLASDFFNPDQIIKTVTTTVPQFDCNVGLNLSDSEEEVFEAIPSTSRDAADKVLDFNAHENFNKDLENAKEQLRNFKSTNFGQDSDDVDVTKLLAIGEPSLVAKKSSKTKRKLALSSSDESDFEEVEEDVKKEKKSNVEVRIGPVVKQKVDKHQAEIEASIKRKINRRKKENQLMMHKVHLLSWIAYGNFVNKVLNSTNLMEMIVKFIPSETCYPKEQTDQKYFEQIVKWFKTTVGLKHKEQNCNLKCLPPVATSLALQIQSKMAICKKDFVFIFVILLRSMGIQCRLVINFATVPLRPAAKDLCVISTKSVAKSVSGDQTKAEKKPTKTSKESTKNAENDVKNSKSSKAEKLKSRTNSITGKKSEIQTESTEATTGTKSLKSKIEAALSSQSSKEPNNDKKPNLKRRAVSVQSVSSINGNMKRSRIKNSDDTKATIATKTSSIQNGTENEPSNEVPKKSLKRRSLSLQSTSSSGKVAVALSSNRQKSGQLTKTKAEINDVNPSPISRRTRRALTRLSSIVPSATITSQTIPQLDGGNDKKSKTRKPDLYKIKFPLRSRSISPSSSNATQPMPKTLALVSPRARATSRGLRLRLPPTSRSKSKSPTATSEHISRKSKLKETTSHTTSPSPTKSTSKLEKDSRKNTVERKKRTSESKSPEPTSMAAMKNYSPLKLTPVKLPSNPSKTLSDAKAKKKSTREEKPKPSSKSPVPSKNTTVAVGIDSPLSPVKLASDPRKTLSAATKSNSKVNASIKTATTSKKSDPASSSTVPSKRAATSTSTEKLKPIARATRGVTSTKNAVKRKPTKSVSSDSDFAPTPKKKSSPAVEKPLPRQVEKLKKRIDRRILSTDDESIEPALKKDDMNYWIEVFCEAESKWICIDMFKMKVNCVDEIKKKATKPIAYVLAWNNNNKIKDVTPRYCSQWNTTTRKLRVESEWLDEAMSRYKEPLSQRCVAEDRELEEIHAQTPIPTSISELKNHPLYVLPRHLLKFEGIYPPNSVPLGYLRDEPIYSRFCVHTLHSREIWVKQARVVKPAETPYKIVKARPKWDRLANKMLEAQPLEIFGRWQTDPYVPPTAENGIVPRNAYGNVELFKPEMLPKKTCHLRLAGLNRVCAKLKIDCAQAVVGFDFHGGSSHPTFDGFVVCEEFAELVTERWCEEQEESYRKSKEKQNQRIYDNWKKLIKGLLIRERLQRKYNFAGKDSSSSK